MRDEEANTESVRHDIVTHLVVRGLTPPEVVIVHAGQVVMDEGHGMQHLQGTGCWHGLAEISSH
jgi:hypothetical protein